MKNSGEGKHRTRIAFFVGWLLSPFTFWNDCFINIPLAYLMANLTIKIIKVDFLMTVVVYYWVTNILGVILMYMTGRELLSKTSSIVREAVKLVAAMIIYSAALVALYHFNILKPL